MALYISLLTILLLCFSLQASCDVPITHECHRQCTYPADPKVCDYIFEAKWFYAMSDFCFDCPFNLDDCFSERCVSLDGVARPVVVTNYSIPGPSIQVCEGDTVRVKLLNNLQDHGSLTIHWYGMHQEGTNWMDGASMITQCPVVSSSSFVYEFKASPAGTHWWHAHSAYMRDDGMYGSLIVGQAQEVERNSYAYDFDLPEHVITVADWKSRPAMATFLFTESPSEHVIAEDQTFAILVNGRYEVAHYDDDNGTPYYFPMSMFEVEVGMTYRFRMINACFGLCNLKVSIDCHPLTIIAVDGAEVAPKEVDSFVIAPGERYDFLVKATAEPGAYLINFNGTEKTECVERGSAILVYEGLNANENIKTCKASTSKFLTDTPIFSIMDSHSLSPASSELNTVDTKYYISMNYVKYTRFSPDGRQFDYTGVLSNFRMDNMVFVYPNNPLIFSKNDSFQICHSNDNPELYVTCRKITCKCTNILKIALGQVVELILFNMNVADMSVHMHGNSFRVLAQDYIKMPNSDYGPTKEYMIYQDKHGYLSRIDPTHALLKDTVNVPGPGYVILRWKADNPGYWFFHAQTNSHLETGQAIVLQVGEGDELPTPPEDMPSCGPSDVRKYKK